MKTSFGIVPLILTLTVLTTMPGVSPAASKNDGRRDGGSLAYGEYGRPATLDPITDRKSTRLNSSHSQISYAVFCLKKKQMHTQPTPPAISRRAVRQVRCTNIVRSVSRYGLTPFPYGHHSSTHPGLASAPPS